MELFDILDQSGKFTGTQATRADAHQNGLWHRTAHVWIINNEKQLLVQQRTENKETHPGQWDISAAGHVSAGETSREAALKELQEELGLVVAPEELLLLFTFPTQTIHHGGTFFNNEFTDVYLLKRDLDSATMVLQPEEVAAVRWISLAELERVLRDGDETFVPHSEEYSRLLAYLRSQS